MITRHVAVGLALAGLALTSGCCHPFCRRPATVVSSSPGCCAPGAPVAVAAPVQVPPPPVQSYSAPPPGAAVIQ